MSTDYALLRTLLQLSRTRTDVTDEYLEQCTRFLDNRIEGEKDDYRNLNAKLDRAIAAQQSK